MDELLQKAAAAMGMPPALAERSAQARAEKEGTTVEAVLREWAGEEPAADDAESEPEVATEAAAPEPAADASPAPSGEAPTEVTTDYLVQLAAEAKRMPPKLVLSSAEARARNSKQPVDEVLAAWAGVDLDELSEQVANGTAPVPEAAPTADAPPAAAAAPEPDDEPAPAPAAAAPVAAAAVALSMDELLEKVAEAKGMPAALAKRSAEARAKKTGEPLEAVLAEWAGIEPGEVAAAAEAPASDTPPAPAAAAPAAAAAAATMSMDELLEKVAEAKGMPAALAKRSAEARAKKTGEPLEAVLAEWAGVDPSVVAGAAAATAAPAPAAEQSTPADATPTEDEAPAAAVEVIEPEGSGDDGDDDASDEPELAAAAPRSGYPTWLAAAFVLIPLLAVTYILVAPNGPDCGTAGQLKIEESTGLAVNCDGSEYGSSSVDFFAQGAALYTQCAACHGSGGEGGVGPAFTGGAVLATFPVESCDDHVEWVTLGTANWPDATYGATNKPVGGVGVMPGYDGVLTPEQIAAVSLYERVQFGGQPIEQAEVDCGLVEGEGGEGEGGEGDSDEMTEAAAP